MLIVTNKNFRLGHVYDVTEFYKANGGDNMFAKYLLCNDVFDFHIYRIVVGYNSEYDVEPRTKLIEQSDISKWEVMAELERQNSRTKIYVDDSRNFPTEINVISDNMDIKENWFKLVIKAVINSDTYDNDALNEYRFDTPIEELLNDIDGGYGITVLDKDLNEVK